MSNCITIDEPFISITDQHIDIAKVIDLVERGNIDSSDNAEMCAGWYLTNVAAWEFDTLRIPTNGARSSHTWRSFKAMMLNCIKPFMRPNQPDVYVELTSSDESDGYHTKSTCLFNLTQGHWSD